MQSTNNVPILSRAELAASEVRRSCPLVHCLTNTVTINDVANALIAIGASPIMAEDACESAEVTEHADALVINLGMPSPGKLEAMLRSGRAARTKGIPIVFDPVGVALTEFRRQAAEKILTEVRPNIIRGNFSEISYLAELTAVSHGVDSTNEGFYSQAERISESIQRAESVSQKYGAITILTGEQDIITDGQYTEVQAGCSIWLTRMAGAGCVLSALIAAYAAISCDKKKIIEPSMADSAAAPSKSGCTDDHAATIELPTLITLALAAMQNYRSAAIAAEKKLQNIGGGNGMYRLILIDSLYTDTLNTTLDTTNEH